MWMEQQTETSEMSGIRIAIIGPEVLMQKILNCLKGFPSFDPIIKCYKQISEAGKLASAAAMEAEVLLFAEHHSYQLVKGNYRFEIPALFIPLTASGLYRSLFCLKRNHPVTSISVDSLTLTMIKTVLDELGSPEMKISVYENNVTPTEQELLSFHREQFQLNRSSCALTSSKIVTDQLNAEGVPSEWIAPTEQDIIVTLERALLATEWRRNKEAQIVMGIIHVDNFSKLTESLGSEQEVRQLRLGIHHVVLNFAEYLDGHLTQVAGNEYLFVTTRGIFERETGGYKRIPLAKKAQKSFGLLLSIGVGFGYSAGEAGEHARQALRLAQDGGGNNCFILREDESVIGPLEMTEPMELDLSLVDSVLVKRAESAGLTSIYLSKLIAHITRFGKLDYYAQDLASVLGVTTRSAHRFLLNWMDAGLVDIIGEEKGASRGRPRQKYRIQFLNGLIR